MYKLLIVEDEKWEREGLVHFLDWPQLGIEIIGAAPNGERGLEIAKAQKPDILITDIKMPVMDGLRLAKEMKNISPDCQMIIVTGYDEFEYAQEALSYSVYEYLLKPIQKESLLETIKRVVDNIDRQINESIYAENLHAQLNDLLFAEREKYLQSLIAGRRLPTELSLQKRGGDFFDYEYYTAAVIKLDLASDDYYADIDCLKARQKDVCSCFYRLCRDDCLIARDEIIFCEIVLCLAAHNSNKSSFADKLSSIIAAGDPIFARKHIVGVGSCVKTMDQVARSYMEAKSALDQAFLMSEGDIVFYEDIKNEFDMDSSVAEDNIDSVADFSKKLLNQAVDADIATIMAATENAFYHLSGSGVKRSELYDYFNCFINELRIFSANINDLSFLKQTIYQETFFERFFRLDDLKEWLQKLLVEVHNNIKCKMANREKQLSDQAMAIIKRDYSQNIGIDSIAHSMNISANYLSSIFNKHAGRSFSTVLTEYRIKKAEELLADKTCNILDIAQKVGFSNASYFSTVFKKVNGSTPIEFRQKRRKGGKIDA